MPLSDCAVVTSVEKVDPSLTLPSVSMGETLLSSGGASLPGIGATWDEPTNVWVTGIQFQYWETGGAVTTSPPQVVAQLAWASTTNVITGTVLNVRWRAVGVGSVGEWSTTGSIPITGSFTAGSAASVTWGSVTGPGRPEDNADVTGTHIASGITGQAPAATDSTIQAGATKNTLTISSTAPTSPTDGDLWVDTSTTPFSYKTRGSGAWTTASTVGGVFGGNLLETTGGSLATLAAFKTILGVAASITGQAPAATDSTIQAGATKNTITVSTTAPASPGNGDMWVDTSVTPNLWKTRVAGAWVTSSSLGAVFGSTLYETVGGTLATLVAFKTILGVASSITGQGAFATINQITSGNSNTLIATEAILAGMVAAQAIFGEEFYALLRVIVGVGEASLNLDGTHATTPLYIGSSSADDAPFRVGWDGTMDARRVRIYGPNDAVLIDTATGSGLTAAAIGGVLGQFQTTFLALATLSGAVTHAASTGAITSMLSGQLGAESPVTLTGKWQLANAVDVTDTFPSSVTLKVYYRYKSTAGGSYGSWTQLGSDQTFTKVTSGTPTSSQYKVISTTEYTNEDLGGGGYIRQSYTLYSIANPNGVTFSISAGTLPEGYYQFAVVGGSSAPFNFSSTLLTATDNDNEPSWVIAGSPTVGIAPYSLPSNSYDGLVCKSTGNATFDIDAAWAFLRTVAGNPLTIEPVDLSVNCATNGANGLDTGSLAANTFYRMWVISNGQTVAGLASLSTTAPTMPTGYSYKAIIGTFLTDASGNIRPFVKRDRDFQYISGSSGAPELATTAGGTAGNVNTGPTVAISLTGYLPSSATKLKAQIRSGSNRTCLHPNNSAGAFDSPTNPPFYVIEAGGTISVNIFDIVLEDPANIYWASSASTTNNGRAMVRCVGYTDRY